MSGPRFLALIATAALVGCGSMPSGPAAAPIAGAPSALPKPAAADPNQPVNGYRTAASDVFRNLRAAPAFEGYISGR